MYRILDKLVAAELVADTIRSKVVPYVQRHDLNLDDVLLSYIKVGWLVLMFMSAYTVDSCPGCMLESSCEASQSTY